MAIDKSKGSAHWWLGPNSLFGTVLKGSVYGKDGTGEQGKKTVKDWIEGLFSGTGVKVTAGVSPDEEFSKEMKIGVLLLLVVWMGTR